MKKSIYQSELMLNMNERLLTTLYSILRQNILRYYDLLAAIHPNPVVALHRLSVICKVSGMQRTLEEIDDQTSGPDGKRTTCITLCLAICTRTVIQRRRQAIIGKPAT